MTATCGSCPAFNARGKVEMAGGIIVRRGECRLNPLPVSKQPDDWCAWHPALSGPWRLPALRAGASTDSREVA